MMKEVEMAGIFSQNAGKPNPELHKINTGHQHHMLE